MQKELQDLENNSEITLAELENKMIEFGYQVWPWNQAYKYFLTAATEQSGDHFLLPRMSPALQKKYLAFQQFGGTLTDLHSGRPASFFTSDERAELCERLVDMRQHLKEYVNRAVVGIEKTSYLRKVEEYQNLLEKIQFTIESLRNFMEKEEYGSPLIGEINAKIRHFEQSLCLLGTEMDYEAVCQAQDFFVGRKLELSRFRGINIPTQIDFLNN